MIPKVVIDAVTSAVQQRTLYVSVELAQKSGFQLSAEFTLAVGITMLVGPSGAGKTTLLDCIAGLVRPDRGRIVAGENVLFDDEQRITVPTRKRRCGYLFQDLALFPHMTVRHNIEYGLADLPHGERAIRADRIMQAFHIDKLSGRRPAAISGGEQQRVAIARALVTDPDFLLLDEPLTALDAATKSRILDDLRRWNASHAIPILYVTHDRSEAYALGERILVLESGRIVAEGTPHEVLDSPRRETVAQLSGFENVFDAVVQAAHENYGTMTCRLVPAGHLKGAGPQQPAEPARKLPPSAAPDAQVKLEVPLVRAEPGEHLRLGVRAGDILISLERPTGLSARNMIPVKIVALRREGTTMIAETVSTEQREIRFIVHLTPRAVENLRLATGEMVWLVLKTHSCHLMRN
jgi:molybdate transport system ATP-binding protein